MDRERFDALTRLLGAEGSRRAALGAAIAAAIGGGRAAAARKGGKKKKKKNTPPRTCFGTNGCQFPSDGQDLENCDFAGTEISSCDGCNFRRADLGGVDFDEGSYQGASFREANLRGANLSETDVSGASFRDACLVDANLFGANTDGAHFGGAILCNTILPIGEIDDSGCGDATACCGGECIPGGDCDNDGDCCAGEVCDGGTCTGNPDPTCAGATCSTFVQCGTSGGGEACFCLATATGGGFCATGSNPCGALTPCPNGQSDCPQDTVCIVQSCCIANVCQPLTFRCEESQQPERTDRRADGPTVAQP